MDTDGFIDADDRAIAFNRRVAARMPEHWITLRLRQNKRCAIGYGERLHGFEIGDAERFDSEKLLCGFLYLRCHPLLYHHREALIIEIVSGDDVKRVAAAATAHRPTECVSWRQRATKLRCACGKIASNVERAFAIRMEICNVDEFVSLNVDTRRHAAKSFTRSRMHRMGRTRSSRSTTGC
jgi:hypothetical protein